MENPHEQVQNALLSRIITNIEKLNEAVIVLNRTLQDVNRENMNVELLSQMWENYQRNVLFNLESTGSLEKPI
ncbi:DASH complex subunit Dad4 [Myxozyma melibiosi]|uniref:DASH complex subunit DAD4 n=1 Tax=Myxozyma melibiosi TaxID=54550 RepID=A0ABR1F1L9_9ASCO